MEKLRDSERGREIHLVSEIEVTIPREENAMEFCKCNCDAVNEVMRLRELTVDQRELIEFLRQALKERERKLDLLSNKKRKEEFYKQWLELEPVAEVDDEDDYEEGDSGLSTAPSSLSLQPGGWQANGVTHEVYEALLLEFDELHTRYAKGQQELAYVKGQVRDLEKALLQETRGSQNTRRALSEKLREVEDRQANYLAEISELKEQNELLEFRVLELEEIELRENPDTADSGVVSPELSLPLFRDHENNKKCDRAIATVIPYNSYNNLLSSVSIQKSSLLLQETDEHKVTIVSCGTQTETPAGELLQEIQRLQELREKIQERTTKVSAISNDSHEVVEDNRLLSYKNKIRELEEKLDGFSMAEEKRSHDQLIVKQREEDLLDENYRLTEKIYWLESEMKKYRDTKKFIDIGTMTTNKNVCDSSSMTDTAVHHYKGPNFIFDFITSMSHCQKIIRNILHIFQIPNFCSNSKTMIDNFSVASKFFLSNNSFEKCKNCQEKIQLSEQNKSCFCCEIIKLEQKIDVFIKIFEQFDTKWLQSTSDSIELENIKEKLSKSPINQSITIKVSKCEDSYDEINAIHCKIKTTNDLPFSNSSQENCKSERLIVENKNLKKITTNQVDCNNEKYRLADSSKILTKPLKKSPRQNAEDTQSRELSRIHDDVNPADTCAMIRKSDAEEKVRNQQLNNANGRKNWARKTWKAHNCPKNCVKSIIDLRRFVLYPEICV